MDCREDCRNFEPKDKNVEINPVTEHEALPALRESAKHWDENYEKALRGTLKKIDMAPSRCALCKKYAISFLGGIFECKDTCVLKLSGNWCCEDNSVYEKVAKLHKENAPAHELAAACHNMATILHNLVKEYEGKGQEKKEEPKKQEKIAVNEDKKCIECAHAHILIGGYPCNECYWSKHYLKNIQHTVIHYGHRNRYEL